MAWGGVLVLTGPCMHRKNCHRCEACTVLHRKRHRHGGAVRRQTRESNPATGTARAPAIVRGRHTISLCWQLVKSCRMSEGTSTGTTVASSSSGTSSRRNPGQPPVLMACFCTQGSRGLLVPGFVPSCTVLGWQTLCQTVPRMPHSYTDM